MPKEYIEREAVIKEMKQIKSSFSPTVRPMFDVMKHIVSKAPTADVVEVRHGEWIERIENPEWLDDDVDVYYECSACGASGIGETPYCHNCGAKMDGERKDEK